LATSILRCFACQKALMRRRNLRRYVEGSRLRSVSPTSQRGCVRRRQSAFFAALQKLVAGSFRARGAALKKSPIVARAILSGCVDITNRLAMLRDGGCGDPANTMPQKRQEGNTQPDRPFLASDGERHRRMEHGSVKSTRVSAKSLWRREQFEVR
jgi:hypothetical protein